MRQKNWFRRIAWLVIIWLTSVGALALFAFGLRLLMVWAGFKTH